MNEKQRRVLKVEVKPNCYLLFSAGRRDPKETYGEFRVQANVSFLYDAGEYAAEWEVEYGPIQIWHKCEKDSEGATEHYFYDYDNSPRWNWSQMAVDSMELPKAANDGDWDYIFNVLKNWADDR